MENFKLIKDNLHLTFENFLLILGYELPENFDEMVNFISFDLISNSDHFLLNIKPKPPKRKTDDVVYAKYPFLLQILPRGFTLFFDTEKNFYTNIVGLRKFTGKSYLDDDDISDMIDNKSKDVIVLFDMTKIKQWASESQLEITKTEKANGKACFVSIKSFKDTFIIAFGSKNKHHLLKYEDYEEFIEKENSDITIGIINDIYKNFEKLKKLVPYFEKNYTLCGELCDGLHFVEGDNTITWFSLSNIKGEPLEPMETFEIIEKCGLKTVNKMKVYEISSNVSSLEKVFIDGKKDLNEGSVLYCRNTITNETLCCKIKTPWYIVWRMTRAIMTSNILSFKQKIKEKLISKANYTGLSTEGCIKVDYYLIRFVEWFILKGYPVKAVGFTPIKATKGILENGFVNYWKKFTKENDISQEMYELEDKDIGDFDRSKFLFHWNEMNHSLITVQPTVIFMIGTQGMGKSTIADLFSKETNYVRIEQDECYGCTQTCLAQLDINLKKGKNCIISRCNTCPKQYNKYLNVAYYNNAKIVFIAPENITKPLSLAIGIAGIIYRSKTKDKVMVGRNEYELEKAIEFTVNNYLGLKLVNETNYYSAWNIDDEMNKDFVKIINSKSIQQIQKYVEENYEKLMRLRNDTEITFRHFKNSLENCLYHPRKTIPDLVGLYVIDKDELIKTVLEIDERAMEKDVILCDHLTVIYKPRSLDLIKPFTICTGTIIGYVINDNGASAFRIKDVETIDGETIDINSKRPHITACLNNSRPMDSLSFVYDDTKKIIPIEKKIKMVCKWI